MVNGNGDRSISPISIPDKNDKRSRTGSIGSHRGSVGQYLDFENSSLYDADADFEEDNDNDNGHETDSPTSYLSLEKTNSLETLEENRSDLPQFDDHMFEEKVNFPSIEGNHFEDIPLEIQQVEEPPWIGMTYEYLLTPKYVKYSRRNKHSPKVISNLFLAQELNQISNDNNNINNINNLDSNTSGTLSDEDDSPPSNSIDHIVSGKDDTTKVNKNEIFVMEFSRDGKYLATAGEDSIIRIWKVISSPLGRLEFKNSENSNKIINKDHHKSHDIFTAAPVFHQKPFKIFKGHSKSILSLDWSKNNFLVSGSMDRTVKLWHVERDECLKTFQHEDFVTTAKFHPTDDRFFLSGSLDNHARLWSILEEKVAYNKNLGDDVLITASEFTPDGQYIVIGGFNGSVFILETKGLFHINRFEIKDRSMVNPFHNKNGNKITGIKIFANEYYNKELSTRELDKWSFLLTTNDSKVRLVNWNSKRLVTRFKGLTNNSSSIVASINDNHHYIISGSEDHWCYIWENNNSIINNKLKASLKELVIEGKHHLHDLQRKHKKYSKIIDDNKYIKKFLEDDSEDFDFVSNENNSYSAFHAHHSKVNSAIFAPQTTKRLLELSDDIIYDLLRRGKACHFKSTAKNFDDDPLINGEIIITTDQTGLIRVFRQDSAYKVRKRFLDMYKKGPCVSVKRELRDLADSIHVSDSSGSISNLKDNCVPSVSSLKLDVSKKLGKHGRSISPSSSETYFNLKLPNRRKPPPLNSNQSSNSVISNSTIPITTTTAIPIPTPTPTYTTSSLINLKQHVSSPMSGIFTEDGVGVGVDSKNLVSLTESEDHTLTSATGFSPTDSTMEKFPSLETNGSSGTNSNANKYESLEINFRSPSTDDEKRQAYVERELSKLGVNNGIGIDKRGRKK
ncbi:WD40-repeat-containing domain protein [Scheffersomyces amazonensis]|uniref:WD40-repeat-containing domain protein n=1 Tax=Scheffersomyces amazonensis TaxID=1078765 RepID=UPI00315DBD25